MSHVICCALDDCAVHSNPLILLGAGASAEAGVPVSHRMTEALVEAMGRTARARYLGTAQALNFVCGALIAYDAAGGTSPYAGLDVERVFAAVRLLAERRDLEISPFVGAWHPAVETWDRPPRIDPPGFDRRFRRAVLSEGVGRPSSEIVALVKGVVGTGTGATYARLAQELVGELRHLLALTSKDVEYLGPLVDVASRPGGVTVATLNYDISVELASGGRARTGIANWITGGSWLWPDEGLRLLKLHGSIDWSWQPREQRAGWLPERVVAVSDDPANDSRSPAIVFGQREKLRAEGPFLSLLAEFEKHLAASERLIAVGYSFRDDHINEVLRRWLNGSGQRRVTIVDPYLPESVGRDDFRGELLNHLGDEHRTRATVWRLPASTALERLRDGVES